MRLSNFLTTSQNVRIAADQANYVKKNRPFHTSFDLLDDLTSSS